MFVPGEEDTDERFSTSTSILDLQTGKEVADLEQVPVTRNGKPFSTDGLEFSAVTFVSPPQPHMCQSSRRGPEETWIVLLRCGNCSTYPGSSW